MPDGDQLSIATPELIALEFAPAGVGSRGLALFLDYTLQGGALLIALICWAMADLRLPGQAVAWMRAAWILIPFLLQWGYFAFFEAFWKGQTPGKRMLRLRVISESGRAVTFWEALLRNLLRVVDFLPALYTAGAVSIFWTRRQQRLGDLAAGTLVVHEQHNLPAAVAPRTNLLTPSLPVLHFEAAAATGLPADRLARLTAVDLALIESYAARRLDLPFAASEALAAKLAREIAAKMEARIPETVSPATFLEGLAAELRAEGRVRAAER